MSGASVAKKINKSMSKVQKKLGFSTTHYRPDIWQEPIDHRNIVAENYLLAWSVDESYRKNPTDELDHYIVYVSSETVKLGDIFVCEAPATTIIITDIDPIRIPAGIRADERVDIYSPVFDAAAAKKMDLKLVFNQVPMAIKIGSSQGVSAPTTAALSGGRSTITGWTWMLPDVKIDDVVEWKGQRYHINSVDASVRGVKFSAVSVKAGK